jgi:uncharacterized damage-inducible protein DinB
MSEAKRIDLTLDPELHPRLALLMAQMDEVRADLKTYAERWADEDLDEILIPGMMSPGGLLLHIAEAEHWWLRVALACQGEEGKLPPESLFPFHVDENGDAVAGERPLTEYLGVLDDTRTWTRDFLRGLDAEDLSRDFPFSSQEGEDYVFSVEWVLYHLVEHEAHHRGQLALMHRLGEALRSMPEAD